MSWDLILKSVLTHILAIGLGIFLGKFIWTLPEIPKPEIVYITGDTIYAEKPVIEYIIAYRDIVTRKISDSLFVTQIDTTLINNKDTLQISNKITSKGELIDFVQKINHKDYASFRIDTLKIPVKEIEYVEKERFILDTFIGGSLTTIIAAIILILLL